MKLFSWLLAMLTLSGSAWYFRNTLVAARDFITERLPRMFEWLAFGGRIVKKVNHPESTMPARNFMPISGDGVLQPEPISGIQSLTHEFLRSVLDG